MNSELINGWEEALGNHWLIIMLIYSSEMISTPTISYMFHESADETGVFLRIEWTRERGMGTSQGSDLPQNWIRIMCKQSHLKWTTVLFQLTEPDRSYQMFREHLYKDQMRHGLMIFLIVFVHRIENLTMFL